MRTDWRRSLYLILAMVAGVWLQWLAAFPLQNAAPQAKPSATATPASQKPKPSAASPSSDQTATGGEAQKPFFIHAYHNKELGLDCSACHVPAKEGSVVLQRPGHDQCMTCHQDAFGDTLNPKICAQCHTSFPPSSSEDLMPFPRFKNKRSILLEFSHAKHVDPKGRIDSRTGLRADCAFCHTFDEQGVFASFPGHTQCASCHSKAGMKPSLTADSTTADCRGCHNPEGIENPVPTKRPLAPQVISGRYAGIQFSHIAHLKSREEFHANCTTCHYDIPSSTSLASLTLPKMADCAQCHQTGKAMSANYRMTNCQSCHVGQGLAATPTIYSREVKPPSHTEDFRVRHATLASEAGANCFVCHTDVAASATGKAQCLSCHQIMLPVSHTARWRDDIHGKYAAIDRTTCAVCHATEYCSRCHNELPRSHVPLAQFKSGAHARLAMLNERSCLTCHTFQNTCAECHTRNLQ